ncbi:putative NmrA-like family domain-containing protein 1 [Xylogone sp. PMI_703]|nr:putative NmrA-like family domain-containing protein 1 [Xylogone sp. PMI_703]
MASKKILVVFGATGAQGGSVARAVLSDSKMRDSWAVRGITRDVNKPPAKELKDLGAEVVSADLNDPSTLKPALKGAYAVYAVTNYWEKADANVEMAQGKAIADEAKAQGVQHFVWSSLLNVSELSKGVLTKVHHFDSKAHVEEYIRSIDIPATYFLPGFYMSNLPGGMFRPNTSSQLWTLNLPIPTTSPVPLFDTASDTGKFVKGILLNREKVLGKRIPGATAYYTVEQIVSEFREMFPEAGKGAMAVQVPESEYIGNLVKAGRSPESAEEMAQNMRLMGEFGYFGGMDLKESHSEFMGKSKALKDLK